jgi:competence ComEA-like helix-hairpin-helix protein
MLSLTKQERLVLLILALVIFVGSILHYAFKKYPQLRDLVNLIESDRLYPKVDVNTASHEELVAIPYIGDYTAAEIIKYREMHGPFTNLEQLKSVRGIRDKNYEKFRQFLKVENE